MEFVPRVAAEFELGIDTHPALKAIQMLNFYQLKGITETTISFKLLWQHGYGTVYDMY